MKKITLAIAILSLMGCTSTLDWQRTEMTGRAGNIPYNFDLDDQELTFNLYQHNTQRVNGQHNLIVEDDEIKYRLKYVF